MIVKFIYTAAPDLYEFNFNSEKTVFVGSHVNFTVQVCSNISLTSGPLWSRHNADLPEDSDIMNYTKDGNNYNSLIIKNASYDNDGGLYYLNASNYCGFSSVSVHLNVDKKGNTRMVIIVLYILHHNKTSEAHS